VTVTTRGKVVLRAAVSAVVVVLLGASGASAAGLVPSSTALKSFGLTPGRASGSAGLAQLDAGLHGSFKGITVAASSAHKRGQGLSSDAFTFKSASAAGRVLAEWSKLHHAKHVQLGSGGDTFETKSRKQEVAQVLWREGSLLGLVVLTATQQLSSAPDAAIGDATLAQSFLDAPVPTTSWGKVLAQIGSNGTVSKTTALEAFALAYGPLPGVHPPSGRKTTIPSGTEAAQWVLQYFSQLTSSQQRVVDRLLGLPATGKTASARVAILDDSGFTPSAAIEAQARFYALKEAALLGRPLTLSIIAGPTTTSVNAYADTQVFNASETLGSGLPAICRIRVPPAGQEQETKDPTFFGLVLAHEVFHCFQGQMLGTKVWNPQPAWVIEGTADWVALTVDPVSYSIGGRNLTTYVNNPGVSLFSRSYDAVGFWGHVQDTFGDLWSRIDSILNAGSNTGAFDAAGANTVSFMDSWGSSPFRVPSGGLPWEMNSPISPPISDVETPTQPIYPAGIPANVFAAPYTTAQYLIHTSVTAPLLNISIDGAARLSPKLNDTGLHDAWFCTVAEQFCVCPKGTTGTVPPHRSFAGGDLGLAADDKPNHGTVEAYPLSSFCHPKSTNVPGGSGNGGGGSGGDPHLFAFHGGLFGGLFNFQATGEYTLVKSTNRNDDFEIQVRQQPFPHSKTIAVNTAVAMHVGTSTVEVDTHGLFDVTAYVNKKRASGNINLSDGGHVSATSGLVTVRWSDGTTANVYNGGASPNFGKNATGALAVAVDLSHDRRGKVEGLLGNWGGSTEFVGRTGQHFPENEFLGPVPVLVPTAADLNALYDKYGPSWRITRHESLFMYPRGKNTNSYTVHGFPSEHVTSSTLPPNQQVAGQTACEGAGITNAGLLNACEVDVGETGNKGFAAGDQRLAGKSKLPPTPPPTLHPIELGAGTNQPELAYDHSLGDTYVVWLDHSNSSIDVCAVTSTSSSCNSGAGPHQLVDPLASSGGATPVFFDPQVLVQPGGSVVVVAEIDGASSTAGYSGLGDVAWSSAAGGAGFAAAGQGIADGGHLLDSSAHSGEAPSSGAIALDQSDIGVYGNTYPFGSGFTDFTLDTPAPAPTPVVDSSTNFSDQIGVNGNQLASIPDPSAPGEDIVVAVGGAVAAPRGCPAGGGDATGYGVGVGTPSALQHQAAWSSSYFVPISCQASSPVLSGGGPTGGTIGVLEDEGPGLSGSGADGVYYRRFGPTNLSFGTPALVSSEQHESLTGADQLSASQDSAGGVYATWADQRGFLLSYSPTGGASWPLPQRIGLTQSAGDVNVAGVGAGNAELAYTAGPNEYLVPVSYLPR